MVVARHFLKERGSKILIQTKISESKTMLNKSLADFLVGFTCLSNSHPYSSTLKMHLDPKKRVVLVVEASTHHVWSVPQKSNGQDGT